LVVKTFFYLPQGQGKRSPLAHFKKAVDHLEYMGNPKKEELVRAGEGDDPRESAAVHAAYMQGRPGSTGYIGPSDTDLPDPDALAEELRQHQGPVWRVIVSVTEKDAKKLDLLDRPRWEETCRSLVPKMADHLAIRREDLVWVAAMHRKRGHPHIHLLFWERGASRERGMWSDWERKGIRQDWIKMLYAPERDRLAMKMATDRLLVEQGVKEELGQAVPAWRMAAAKRDDQAVTPRLSTPKAEELARRLEEIKGMLPGKGRQALGYMPQEVKAKIRDTTDWLIRSVPEYRKALDSHVEIMREMAGHFSDDPEEATKAASKAEARVRDKVAQNVLRAAVALQNAERREEVLRIAAAATKGGRRVRGMPLQGLPPDLSRHVHAEIQRISHLAPKQRRDEALALARKLLAQPAAAGATRAFRRQLATEAAGKAMPPKWLDEHSSQPLPLPDRFGWLAPALAKDAAGRTPGSDAAQAWHRQINAVHQAPPGTRREAADRAAGWLLRQPETKAALAAHLRSVSRGGRAAAYREVRTQLARVVDHQVKHLAAQWARDQVAKGMDRLARYVGRSIGWAAQYAAFRRANQARQLVMGLYAGLLRQARKEEREAEARALEEEARRKRQSQSQMQM
jgi:hypothetical protein